MFSREKYVFEGKVGRKRSQSTSRSVSREVYFQDQLRKGETPSFTVCRGGYCVLGLKIIANNTLPTPCGEYASIQQQKSRSEQEAGIKEVFILVTLYYNGDWVLNHIDFRGLFMDGNI